MEIRTYRQEDIKDIAELSIIRYTLSMRQTIQKNSLMRGLTEI